MAAPLHLSQSGTYTIAALGSGSQVGYQVVISGSNDWVGSITLLTNTAPPGNTPNLVQIPYQRNGIEVAAGTALTTSTACILSPTAGDVLATYAHTAGTVAITVNPATAGVTNSELETAFLAAGFSTAGQDTPVTQLSAAVAVLLGQSLNVLAFGAKGDGVTDDTAAIQAAVDAATARGARVIGVGDFYLGSKLVISCDADFSGANFTTDGSEAVSLEISTGNASNPTTPLIGRTIVLGTLYNTAKTPGGGWAGFGIGLRIVNALTCNITTGHIRGYAVGVKLDAYTQGCAYNTVTVGYLENNEKNLQCRPGDGTGYVNENVFIGGRFHFRSEEGTNVSGTRHIQLYPYDVANSATSWPNNNTFYSPSLEGDVPEYHAEIGGSSNAIVQGRWETFGGVPAAKVLFTGHASVNTKNLRNLILGGYDADTIAFTMTGVGLWGDLISPRKKVHIGFGISDVVQNSGGDVTGTPVRRVFLAAKNLLQTALSDTDWTVNEYATGIEYKASGDAHPRIRIDYDAGEVYFGRGSGAPTIRLSETGANPGALSLNDDFWPEVDNAVWLGAGTLRWQRVYAVQLYGSEIYMGAAFTGVPSIKTGTGTPEGNVTAEIGSLYLRQDGGVGTALYTKNSGSGTTGWAPMVSA